jgi:hypothetical protein
MPAYVKSVRYSETPTSILLQQAQYAKQQQALLQKAALEDDKARRAIPMGLADKLKNMDAEVQQNEMGSAVADVSQLVMDRAVPTSEVMARAASWMTRISQNSQAVKKFRTDLGVALKDIDKTFGVDKGKMNDFAAAYIAQNINDPSKLTNAFGFVKQSLESQPDVFVDRTQGVRVMQGIVTKAPKASIGDLVSVDATGKRTLVSGYEAKLAPWYRMKPSVDSRTGMKTFVPELKLSADGAIDEGVFNQIYNYSEGANDIRVKMTIDVGARDIIRKNNEGKQPGDPGYLDPKDDGTMELAKRKYVTSFLQTMTEPDFKRRSSVDVAAPKKGEGQEAAEAAAELDLQRWTRISSVAGASSRANALEASDQQYIMEATSKALGRASNISEVYLKKQSDGSIGIFASKDLKDNDNKVVVKKDVPITSIIQSKTTQVEAKQVAGQKASAAAAKKTTAPSAKKKIAGF